MVESFLFVPGLTFQSTGLNLIIYKQKGSFREGLEF